MKCVAGMDVRVVRYRHGAVARMRAAADLGAVQRAPLPRRKHPPRTPGEQVALALCLDTISGTNLEIKYFNTRFYYKWPGRW